MKRERLIQARVLFLIGLALLTVWALTPLFGPWVRVEATVYGLDREVYISHEEDEPNEYFAVLDICYQHDDKVFVDRQYLNRDGPTGWRLQELTQAVEEAKRHTLGETRPILVHALEPERWVAAPPRIWPWILLALFYGAFSLAVGWESPAFQLGALVTALLAAAVARNGGTAGQLPAALDPRPLVAECSALRGFDRLPIGGPRKPDSLAQVLRDWGRPDQVWRETEEGLDLAYLLYRSGDTWEETWTLVFQRVENTWAPLGPPRNEERTDNQN